MVTNYSRKSLEDIQKIEHDDTNEAKRVYLVGGGLSVDNVDLDIGDINLLDTNKNQINPATEDKQDSLSLYKTQVVDNYTTTDVVYICKMKTDGTWLFTKIDQTGNFPTFTYANVSNNATKTTYALAYTDRTSLTYGLLNTLTGV